MQRILVSKWALHVARELITNPAGRTPPQMDYDREVYAAALGVSHDTVWRAIAELVELGAVEHRTVVSSSEGKRRTIVQVPEHWLWVALAQDVTEAGAA